MTAASDSARVLVVEDNATLRRSVSLALHESYHVEQAVDGDVAVERLSDPRLEPFDVVLTDLRLPGRDGIAVLNAARDRDPRTSVILMTAYGSIDTAVEAMRAGAFDFVSKPLNLEQIELRVERGIEQRRLLTEVGELRAEKSTSGDRDAVIGESAALREATGLARRVAATRSTVLVTGETGTGKEVIAGLVHRSSPRAERPFIKVNCAALPETLLESELFGHERGAFTGADRQRIGRFEQANGGTLFLDEVGDMSSATQAKLLRVLQDQEFQRVGGTTTLRTDVRIVSATNQNLERKIRDGSFREDLYFRLDVIRIHLPPLRERSEDLEALARHFLRRFSTELSRPIAGFTPAALSRIRSAPWPGNVRELCNAIERAVLLADGDWIDAGDLLGTGGIGSRHGSADEWCPDLPPAGVSLQDVERRLVLAALEHTSWVQKEAADRLGVSRRKLNYMIQKMGITHPTWRRNRARPAPDLEKAGEAEETEG